jgi:ATP-dependent exoDNAse (exonuclease V) beta subunit
MRTVPNTAILASAGSGKTFALTNRVVALLALGAPPERIVALTFTRKAAGEFFDEILKKLAHAAGSPAEAAKLAAMIGQPALGPADFLGLLRRVVDAMPRLNLGTLDSFFARIVRSFPLELGLGGDLEILHEHAAQRERRRVLRSLFTAAGEPDEAQREFIEAFKRATFGLEEKGLADRLETYLNDYAGVYLAAPQVDVWGNSGRIWPSGFAPLRAGLSLADALTALRRHVEGTASLRDGQRARLETVIADATDWRPGAPLSRPLNDLLEKVVAQLPELRAGRGQLTIDRVRFSPDGPFASALVAFAEAMIGAEFKRRLETTKGLFALLRTYEQRYHEAVRRNGRMTFADVERLLRPDAGGPLLESGLSVAEDDAGERRLAIDWRLDAQFDHWLLDEFQDTSHGQWTVLRNLIDEVVQDPERARSFFYVGDVKQAIYAWREGDSRLFREILQHYNQTNPAAIVEQELNASWRSGPAVIAAVNRVFSDQAALGQVMSGAAVTAWSQEWREHTSARPSLGGVVEWRLADDQEGRFAETLRILQETDALGRGLSVAVLVEKNDTGSALADYLRRRGGLPAVAESDLTVCTDNPFTAVLLAMLRAAAHPGDTLAWGHVRMTPLAAVLAEQGVTSPESLTRRLLREIHAQGFAATLEHWMEALAARLDPADAFSRLRGRQLVEAARDFDELASRDVVEFLQYAERYKVRDADTAAVVRVLTIHKAKGLGFDLVILPDLEGGFGARRASLAVRKAPDRSVSWILEVPNKVFADSDPVLTQYKEEADAQAAYEALCKLYVAMTRAKRAMYLVTQPVAEGSRTRDFPRLLRDTLGEAYREGDARWYEALRPEPPAISGDCVVKVEAPPAPARLPARTPSGTERSVLQGAQVFALSASAGAERGTAVHALLAEIGWRRSGDGGVGSELWIHADAAIRAEAQACLDAPALEEVFARPSEALGESELWRERAFEVVLDGHWITGICDRVVISRESDGAARCAWVWDFKTDRVGDRAGALRAAGRYAEQLGLYRRVVARLTGLAEKEVRCRLVFTQIREWVPMG